MTLPTFSNGYVVQDDDWNAHVSAINTNTSDVSSLDGRLTTAESNISSNDSDIATLDGRVDGNDTAIGDLNTAVGIPYSNGSDLDARVTTLENDSGSGGGGAYGAWQTPSLGSGWSNPAFNQPVKYRTIPGNQVQIIGNAVPNSSPSSTVFDLAGGFQPPSSLYFASIDATGKPQVGYISFTGSVQIQTSPAAGEDVALSAVFSLDF